MPSAIRVFGSAVLGLALVAASALAAGPSGTSNSAALGAAVLGVQSRAAAAAIQAGKPSMVKVSDPANLKAMGLKDVKQGDSVELTPMGEGTWKVKHPKTNEAITVNVQVQKAE